MAEPPSQDPLFPEYAPDHPARVARGERLRDEGMDRVASATPPDWEAAAERALRYACEHRAEVTSEVVWSLLEAWGWPLPPEPRRLGPLMRKGEVTWGWMVSTGRFELASRPSRHRAPIRIYSSVLFGRVTSSNGVALREARFEPADPW